MGRSLAPASEPTAIESFEEPERPGEEADRVVSFDLATPLVLSEGDNLFVAVELAGESGGDRICISACNNTVGATDANYWSNATAPPFDWVTLWSFGLDINTAIWAMGQYE